MSLVVDVDLYHRQKKFSQEWFFRDGKSDVGYTVSTLAFSLSIPCIVILCWIGEVHGYNDIVDSKMKSLIKFYGYTDIKGMPDNFPKDLFKTSEI